MYDGSIPKKKNSKEEWKGDEEGARSSSSYAAGGTIF